MNTETRMTPRLTERIEKAARILKARNAPSMLGWPKSVWRAYWNARIRSILRDIVMEHERMAETTALLSDEEQRLRAAVLDSAKLREEIERLRGELSYQRTLCARHGGTNEYRGN